MADSHVPRTKEWHRDNIEELKLMRQRPYDYEKIILQISIGFAALTMTALLYYLSKNLIALATLTTIILFTILIVFILIRNNFLGEKEKFDVELRKQYDILLGRTSTKTG